MLALVGLGVGLVVGLTGAGGSVLAVPLLVLGAGLSPAQAGPVALLAIGAAAAVGSLLSWDPLLVRWRAALLMAAAGLLAAPAGLLLARALPPAVLVWIFCAVALAVALRLAVQAWREPQDTRVLRARPEGAIRLDPATGRFCWTAATALRLGALGGLAGFVGALLGVGGGFLLVPGLRLLTPLDMHAAVATSLLVIALTASGTTLWHAALHGAPALATAAPLAGGTLAGMLAGRRLARHVAGPALQGGFALMLAIAGLSLVLAA